MLPWNDRAGTLSWLKLTVLLGLLAPGAWIAFQAATGTLGSKPITSAIHQSGDWAVRLLLVGLLVTPLRHVADWPKLIVVRRMIGVAALAYAALHLVFYVVEQAFDLGKVASEIVLRFYLTIGFVALLGLLALGATSTDAMIRRLGGVRWNRLHSLVYPVTALAILHFFLQTRLDVSEPVLMLGFFLWLMGFRLMRRWSVAVSPLSLLGLALAAALLAALAEAGWYAARTGVDASRILEANLDIEFGIRPALWVALSGLLLVAVNLARRPRAARGRRAVAPTPAE
ncbi:sulfite oxidase heme-binding subunit YedZ [Phreatobacter sp.]|uniref:sulfite oxidase heme-binding subunit YedZ n=1 Tax=Phreatobacter sp. TaxID=1966341 RepID=UPI003F6EEA54